MAALIRFSALLPIRTPFQKAPPYVMPHDKNSGLCLSLSIPSNEDLFFIFCGDCLTGHSGQEAFPVPLIL